MPLRKGRACEAAGVLSQRPSRRPIEHLILLQPAAVCARRIRTSRCVRSSKVRKKIRQRGGESSALLKAHLYGLVVSRSGCAPQHASHMLITRLACRPSHTTSRFMFLGSYMEMQRFLETSRANSGKRCGSLSRIPMTYCSIIIRNILEISRTLTTL